MNRLKQKWFRAMAAATLLILSGICTAAQARTPVQVLLAAEKAHERIPRLSKLDPALDMAKALEIQKAYVAAKLGHDVPAGFKAGLTSEKSRQRFGVSQAVTGVLFRAGKLADKAVVDAAAFHLLMIETEIGFVMDRRVTEKFADTEALKAAVRAVVPAIELPDLGFADMKALTGADIVAANVSARSFIAGTPVPFEGLALDGVAVTLSQDGKEVNRGQGSDALGSQWDALLWLANTMIGQGYVLEPGQVLITGALGRMVPGKAGKYGADFGRLGKISFEIR